MPLGNAVIQPMDRAVRSLEERTPVASRMRSRQWAVVPVELREAAFFMARVNDLQALGELKVLLNDALAFDRNREAGRSTMDRGKFIARAKSILSAHGLDTGRDALSNPASRRRLALVWSMQIERAQAYGRWLAGQDPDILDLFPAQELVRVARRSEPRYWPGIWADNGGQMYEGGRMIARKDSPIWLGISQFGAPWPPFRWGSGMGLANVRRDEAIRLGVISEEDVIQPSAEPYTRGLRDSTRGLDTEAIRKLRGALGDQLALGEDPATGEATLAWRSHAEVLREALSEAREQPDVERTVRLAPSPGVTQHWPDTVPDRVAVTYARLRAMDVTGADLALARAVLDYPDRVETGDQPSDRVFVRQIADVGTVHVLMRPIGDALQIWRLWIEEVAG